MLDLGQVELLHPFWLALQAATRWLKPLRSSSRALEATEAARVAVPRRAKAAQQAQAHAAVPIRGCRAVPIRAAPIRVPWLSHEGFRPTSPWSTSRLYNHAGRLVPRRGSLPRRRNVGGFSALAAPNRTSQTDQTRMGSEECVHVWVHPELLQGHASHASHAHNNVALFLNRAFCSQEKYALRLQARCASAPPRRRLQNR